MGNKIILPLDNLQLSDAVKIMKLTAGKVWGYKLRRQIIEGDIRTVVAMAKQYGNVMIDFKLFDIPSAMDESLQLHFECGVDISTVHCTACYTPSVDIDASKIAGVTVLTSMKKEDFAITYNTHTLDIGSTVYKFAKNAVANKYGYMVSSPKELSDMAKTDNDLKKLDIKKICPGIRPLWYQKEDDQERTMTPRDAIKAGADLLVIGRPLLNADNIVDALDKTNAEIENM